MPDLLRQQVPYFQPLVEAFGYRNFRAEGKEADDVIGTLATKAEAAGHRVCVVSTDRDAFQLASENVCIMMTPRGVADVVVYTPDRIMQRYGIGPDLVPDFIGLKGDTSDNIPGVPGIGDKTAAELLVRFGSMEGVYANLDAVSGEKRRENLRAATEDAARSKVLATIDRALEIDVDFDAHGRGAARPLDHEGALPQARVPGAPEAGRRARGGRAGRAGRDRARASSSSGARPASTTCGRSPTEVALAVGGGRAAITGDGADVVVVEADTARVVEALRDRRVITHGLKHPALTPAGDTAIAAYLLDPGRCGLRDRRSGRGDRARAPGRPRTRRPRRSCAPPPRPGACIRAPPSGSPSAR